MNKPIPIPGGGTYIPGERFPLQRGQGSIPWSEAKAFYADYSYLYGTSQSLERLAERGGSSREEIAICRRDAEDKRNKRGRWKPR